MHIYLLKNIYIVYRVHKKFAKSKRFEEEITGKLETA